MHRSIFLLRRNNWFGTLRGALKHKSFFVCDVMLPVLLNKAVSAPWWRRTPTPAWPRQQTVQAYQSALNPVRQWRAPER